jgi:hypothetical protein
MKNRPKARIRVSGHGHDATFVARTVGNAVFQFRRRFSSARWPITLRTDAESGGWLGISIEVKSLAA